MRFRECEWADRMQYAVRSLGPNRAKLAAIQRLLFASETPVGKGVAEGEGFERPVRLRSSNLHFFGFVM